ncbi:MAG: PrpF domain-containing protein [Acetobacteraceae bacterium]
MPPARVPASFPALAGFVPRRRDGVLEFPVHHMRGGTSTGLVIHDRAAPAELALKEELLRHLMGLPLNGTRRGNRQITGLGRGAPTSNKVFFAELEPDGTPRMVSTLAQLAADTAAIDWSVNCGNMSAALPLWALDTGLLSRPAGAGRFETVIRNTNTGVLATARMVFDAAGQPETAEIPGVDGAFPAVDLSLADPVGAKTGRLLPTGNRTDRAGGVTVSCVDVAVPMVIVPAEAFGRSVHEPIEALESDPALMEALRAMWVEAGLAMGLAGRGGHKLTAEDLARSETIPKVCLVGPPAAGGHIAARYFTPQTGHRSMAVSGGCCLAAAALIPGTTAHAVARGLPAPGNTFAEIAIGIENPAGILAAKIDASAAPDGLELRQAAYTRSAQILLRGHVPLTRASSALAAALDTIIANTTTRAAA